MDLAGDTFQHLIILVKKLRNLFVPINLGRGMGISILELVRTFEKVNNIKINFEFIDKREGDKGVVFADCSKAKEILDWEPKHNLSQMCQDGWQWQIKNPNGY